MRKELLKKLLAGSMAIVLVLTAAGCTSQVSKNTDNKDANEEASDCCEGKEKDDCCEDASESLCCKEDKSTGEIENTGTADLSLVDNSGGDLYKMHQSGNLDVAQVAETLDVVFEILLGNNHIDGVDMDGIDQLQHFGAEEMTA